MIHEELIASEEELKFNFKEMEILKEKAEVSNKEKNQFLSNMSHEIRTPLNGICGISQILEMTLINSEQKEYIDMLNESSEHLLGIVNDIFDISKLETGKIQLAKEHFNLKNNLEKLIKVYSVDVYKKGIDVILYYKPLIEQEFLGDVLRLNQILANLIGNAMEFTETGRIILKVNKIDKYENRTKLKFSVEDTGIGIDIELKNKLFKVFNQGDSSSTKKYSGTGLGLDISKGLVTMMNGEIWYESEVNKGSIFHFIIELEEHVSNRCNT